MRSVLFLHGGPGLTAELERRWFGESLPVHWWDQPLVRNDASDPYSSLIDAAIAEVGRLSVAQRGPVGLLAHSFGAYLARALVARIPERIGAITICGGIWDLSTAVLRLGWKFVRSWRDADLESACRQAADADTPQGYFGLFARVSAMPGFLDCYWSPSAGGPREAMKALAAAGGLIDWPTCQALMTAALGTPPPALPVRHRAPVRIIIGRFDPYFDEDDVGAWEALWPGATVEIVEAGQFPHLELPSTVWMPAGEPAL